MHHSVNGGVEYDVTSCLVLCFLPGGGESGPETGAVCSQDEWVSTAAVSTHTGMPLMFKGTMQSIYKVLFSRISMQWGCFSLHNDSNLSPYQVMVDLFSHY